jgi:hypothetical protein
MTTQRLQHDTASTIATQVLSALAPILHESMHKQAWEWLYEIAEREIYLYEVNVNRMRQRMRPLDN